ncbi:MAG: D-2-hydroxyacid dehydrogenase [Ruminococcus sp.]|nr:D-2-hydroxyacid dehydrogenase [Ruminococcus sp.]
MKIVLPDAKTVTNGDLSLEPLKEFGEVIIYELTAYDEIAERVKDADVIICNKTLLNSETLSLAKNLKLILLWATGYNNIDTDYCNSKGITVCNAGSYSTNAVAQHTFALILELINKVGSYNNFVQQGNWQKSDTFSPFVYKLNELAGKTLGIYGYGNIGKAVAKIAKAFDMNVIAYSRSKKSDEFASHADFDTLLKESDIISVHCPLNKQSQYVFNKETFAKMKKGSYFINTARGGVMVEEDLKNALISNHLAGAGIDVLDAEPMSKDCKIMGIKNCIITPHIAWAPMETRERLMDIVCSNLRNFINKTPTNVVNKP